VADKGFEADRLVADFDAQVAGVLEAHRYGLAVEEVGTVQRVGEGIAQVSGLPNVQSEELVRFPGDVLGIALDLAPDHVGVVLLDESAAIRAGQRVLTFRWGRRCWGG
jgi:F-type H+-transporting ATPase subunit alpha